VTDGTNIPAGWYPDPDDPAQQRWWDGVQWTENRAPAAGASAPGAEQPWSSGQGASDQGYWAPEQSDPYAQPDPYAAPGTPGQYPGGYGQQGPYASGQYPGQYPGQGGSGSFPPGAPPTVSRSSRLPLIIAIVVVVAVLAGLAAFLVAGDDDDDPSGTTTTTASPNTDPTDEPTTQATDEPTTGSTPETSTGSTEAGQAPTEPPTGDDEALDELAQSCHQGDMADCDDLYLESDVGTDYEEYGATCGGRLPDHQGRYCEPTIPDPITPG
jgi:hypothetical protein